MSDKIVWEDINRKSYTMDQITDGHLLNIMSFLESGGGYMEYRDKQTFKLMRSEIIRRGLKGIYDRHQLQI
ncbi:MAG TPA: hypothetical protein GXZ90_02145 [Clostridiales bacterium]|nr:hypothetical protein [Clostridiales bacterium]